MSDLNEMWAALEAYQPIADQKGHGESWKRMTTERTGSAARTAAKAAAWDARGAALAASNAAWSAADAADSVQMAATASGQTIKRINEAMEVKP